MRTRSCILETGMRRTTCSILYDGSTRRGRVRSGGTYNNNYNIMDTRVRTHISCNAVRREFSVIKRERETCNLSSTVKL